MNFSCPGSKFWLDDQKVLGFCGVLYSETFKALCQGYPGYPGSVAPDYYPGQLSEKKKIKMRSSTLFTGKIFYRFILLLYELYSIRVWTFISGDFSHLVYMFSTPQLSAKIPREDLNFHRKESGR